MSTSVEEPDRLLALERSGLMGSDPEAAFDRFTRLASRLLRAPVALVSLVDDKRQFFKSAVGMPVRETPLSHSFCQYVVSDQQPLLVRDARVDPRVAENPAVHDLDVIAYLGVPLTTSEGFTLGSLCAIDSAPRDWSDDDLTVLADLAQGVVSEVELRAGTLQLAEQERLLRERSDALGEREALLSAIIENAPAGIMVCDLEGRYQRANACAAATLGIPVEEVPGRAPEEFFSSEAARRIRAQDAAVLKGGEPLSEELTVARAINEERTYEVLKYPIRDHRGTIVGLGSFSLDITARKHAEAELRKSELKLREAQELASFGSWELDVCASRMVWSDELCRIFGQPAGFAPTYEEFIELIHPDDRDEVDSRVQTAWAGSFSASEYRIVRPDGDVRHVHTRRFGRFDEYGMVVELWGTTQDITDRVRAERELREAQERSQAILAGMREGYGLTVDGEIVEVNQALCEMTGFSREELVGARSPFPFWPADLLEQTLELRDRVVGAQGGTFEITLVRKDGSRFESEITAQPAREADGTLLGFVNTIRDVTERAAREREEVAVRQIAHLVAQAAGPEAVFEQVAKAVCGVFKAHSGVVVRFDPAAGNAIFVSAQTDDGRSLTGTELALDGTTAPACVYRTGKPYRTGGARASGYGAEFAPVVAEVTDAVAAPITVAGHLWGCLAVGFSGGSAPDGTEQRLERFTELVAMAIANTEAWEELSQQAATDSLTGLANRRTFQERLESEVARARRYQRELSLVLLDVDHFKSVNDTFGHQIGDAVLVELSRRLEAQARESELVARIGGEEFAWLMPETGRDAAIRAAERVRAVIEGQPFEPAGSLTLSGGICALAGDLLAEDLVRFADEALYAAKGGGRNTTRAHSHP